MRIAERNEIPLLSRLWQTCFHESADIPEGFYASLWDHITVFLNDDATSMIHAMYMTWQEKPAAYLYAVATDPAYQGCGHCHNLMAKVEAYLRQKGVSFLILTPFSSSLFHFYETIGYKTTFFSTKNTFSKTDISLPVSAVSPKEYHVLRNRFMPEGVSYPLPLLQYQESFGQLVKIDNIGCAAIEQNGEHMFIQELLSDFPADAASSLYHYLNTEPLPVKMRGSNPYAMAKSLDGSSLIPSYLGLAFE